MRRGGSTGNRRARDLRTVRQTKAKRDWRSAGEMAVAKSLERQNRCPRSSSSRGRTQGRAGTRRSGLGALVPASCFRHVHVVAAVAAIVTVSHRQRGLGLTAVRLRLTSAGVRVPAEGCPRRKPALRAQLWGGRCWCPDRRSSRR